MRHAAANALRARGRALRVRTAARPSDVSVVRSALAYYNAALHDGGPYLKNLGTLGDAADLRLGSTFGAFIDQGSSGAFLRLPGVAGNYASTPDTAAVSITGDIDIVARIAPDDWTPTAAGVIVAHWNDTGNQRGYMLRLESSGKLRLFISADGITAAVFAESSVANAFTDGTAQWVRATWSDAGDVANFYTANDQVAVPSSWTQLGAANVALVSAGIFDSTSVLEVGSNNAGAGGNFVGRIYYADVRNSIGGAAVAKFDCSAAAREYARFVKGSTSEVWTVNTSAPIAPFVRGGALQLNASPTGGWCAQTVDGNGTDVSGDIDIRVLYIPDSDTIPNEAYLIGKYNTVGNQRSWTLGHRVGGGLVLYTSLDGIATTSPTIASAGFQAGVPLWVRATCDVDDGAGGRRAEFYKSTDGVNWTSLGGATSPGGAGTLFNSTQPIQIGVIGSGGSAVGGQILKAEVRSGIDGTIVASFDASGKDNYRNWSDPQGNPWYLVGQSTVDSNEPLFLPYLGEKYLYCTGLTGNYATTPDSAANSTFVNGIEIIARVAADDWTPATTTTIVGKGLSASDIGYRLQLLAAGTLQFDTSADGVTTTRGTSNAAISVPDGSAIWVRVTLDFDDGGGNRVYKFYTAPDQTAVPTVWTQLGTTVTTVGTTSIFNSTQDLQVGAQQATANLWAGKIYRALVYNADTGGTLIADFDPSRSVEPHTSFVAATGETWTLTRATSGRKLVLVDASRFLLGTDDFLRMDYDIPALGPTTVASTHTATAVLRPYATTANASWRKSSADIFGALFIGWGMFGANRVLAISDNVVKASNTNGSAATDGLTKAQTGVLSGSSSQAYYGNATNGAGFSVAAVTGNTSTGSGYVSLGETAASGGTRGEYELVAAAIWNRALSAAEVAKMCREVGGS